MSARIVGSPGPTEVFSAVARQLPRLAFGVVGAWARGGYKELAAKADTVAVSTEIVDPATGSKTVRTTREITDRSELNDVEESFEMDGAFGVDFPLRPRWTWLRTFVGLSTKAPTEVFYAGFSPLQALTRYQQSMEAIGIDLFVGARLTNRKVASTTGCDGEPPCSERDFRLDGLYGSVMIDGSQVLSSVLKAFVP
jgi:hypothetical protein